MLTDNEREEIKQRNIIAGILGIIALLLIVPLVEYRTSNRTASQGIFFLFLIIGCLIIVIRPRYSYVGYKKKYESKVEGRMFHDPKLLNVNELLSIITDLETLIHTLESNYTNNLVSEEKYNDLKNVYSERLKIFYERLYELRGPD